VSLIRRDVVLGKRTLGAPAIAAGRFTLEVLPWFGPAGLTYDGHEPVAPGTPPCAPAP